MKINISILGNPVAKARPRFSHWGKSVRTYSIQGTDERLWISQALPQIRKTGIFFDGLVEMKIRFYTQRPKSHFGTGRNAGKLKVNAPIFPNDSKDLDNRIKHVCDALNHCEIWVDDAKVIGIDARHRFADIYGPGPSTEIEINDQIEDEI